MKILRKFTMAFASIMMLAIYTQAQATQTDAVLNLEGNPTCSSLGDNHAVLEYRIGDTEGNDGIPTAISNSKESRLGFVSKILFYFFGWRSYEGPCFSSTHFIFVCHFSSN